MGLVNYTPHDWSALEEFTATLADTEIKDPWTAIQAAWTSFTPTWTGTTTNPVIGNGTLTGAYHRVGKLIFYRIGIVAGSTTTYGSGSYRLTLPVAPATAYNAWTQTIGTGIVADSSANLRTFLFATTISAGSSTIALADHAATQMGATTPYTLAVGDSIGITGTYEAA